jgi:hypothetical protein
MNWVLEDRRRRRSIDRQTALRYQLEHTRERGGIEAIAIGDGSGLLVAFSGDPAVCAEMAAIAPVMGRLAMGARSSPLLRGTELSVRSVRMFGQALFLITAGGGVARDAHVETCARGMERILKSN